MELEVRGSLYWVEQIIKTGVCYQALLGGLRSKHSRGLFHREDRRFRAIDLVYNAKGSLSGGHCAKINNLHVRRSRSNVDNVLSNISRVQRLVTVVEASTKFAHDRGHKLGFGESRRNGGNAKRGRDQFSAQSSVDGLKPE